MRGAGAIGRRGVGCGRRRALLRRRRAQKRSSKASADVGHGAVRKAFLASGADKGGEVQQRSRAAGEARRAHSGRRRRAARLGAPSIRSRGALGRPSRGKAVGKLVSGGAVEGRVRRREVGELTRGKGAGRLCRRRCRGGRSIV